MRPLLRFALVTLLASLADAQEPRPGSGGASISGVAVDSLNGGHLKGAVIYVSGTTRSAITDSLGRFRIDSVPAGSRFLEVQHAVLDTAGVSVVTPAISFAADSSLVAIVATPSPETVIALKCTAAQRATGPAALIGMVTDPTTREAVAGATVSLTWTDVDVRERSLGKEERRATGTVDSRGRFRICGLPGDFSANLVASSGADSTAVVGVNFTRNLAIVALLLPLGGDSSTVVRGVVVNASGAPVSDVRVTADDGDAAITGANGQFVLANVPLGTRLLSARKIGLEPVEQVIQVSGKPDERVRVVMSNSVQTLATVRITALSRVGLTRVGFFERQQSAKGRFFDPDRIAAQRPFRIAELIVGLPWVKDVANGRVRGARAVAPRRPGECIEYIVDGRPWLMREPYNGNRRDTTVIGGADRGSPNDWIMGGELAAVEAYESGRAPPEIMRMSTRGGLCHTFVVWTKWKLGIK